LTNYKLVLFIKMYSLSKLLEEKRIGNKPNREQTLANQLRSTKHCKVVIMNGVRVGVLITNPVQLW